MKRLIFRLNDAAKKVCVFLAAFVVCAILSSCSDYRERTESVLLALPSWPPYRNAGFPPLEKWEVRWRSGTTSGAFEVPSSVPIVSLSLDANLPCAVTAQPVTNHNGTLLRFFMPAGAIFPAANKLTWENGFTADLCMELCETSPAGALDASLHLLQFNWGRFSEEIMKKEARAKPTARTPQPKLPLYNPWYVDRDAIRSAIRAGEFKSSLLTVSKNKPKNEGDPKKLAVEVTENTIVKALKRGGGEGDMKIDRLVPQYLPLYAAQNEREKALLKHGEIIYFLIVTEDGASPQKMACITVKGAEESGNNVKSASTKGIKSVVKFLYP